MDFLWALWRWYKGKPKPKLPCMVSFDITHGLTHTVKVITINSSGGVITKTSEKTPHEFVKYTRRCLEVMDFGLMGGDVMHFLFHNYSLLVVINGDKITVPYFDDNFFRSEGVSFPKPELHWSGILPDQPRQLVVHPFWRGSPRLLVTTTGEPLEVAL